MNISLRGFLLDGHHSALHRRVTLRPDSGRHYVRYKENVPDGAVTHTFYRNANGVGINTKYCLLAVTSHSLLLG